MKYFIASGLAVVLCTFVSLAKVEAQETSQKNSVRAEAGKLDDKTTGSTVRVSQLIGQNIQNPEGKAVGEVNDIVLDARSGKARYMAVTYGGFLGVGNKMFAVPFEAFECRQSGDDASEHVLVLDVTPEQLKGAVGFDEDHWPNFGDSQFRSDLDKRYGIERMPRKVKVNVDRNGIDVDVNPEDK